MAERLVGKQAPDFTMETATGDGTAFGKASLSDYKGKWLVLFFYPLTSHSYVRLKSQHLAMLLINSKLWTLKFLVFPSTASTHTKRGSTHRLTIMVLANWHSHLLLTLRNP